MKYTGIIVYFNFFTIIILYVLLPGTRTKRDEEFDLAAEAQEDIKDEVTKIGLLESAEKSAEKVLTIFFDNLGYTVKIKFR